MALDFSLSIYDDEVAERKGQPGVVGFSFKGMTVRQAESGLKYLRSFTTRLERFVADNKELDDMALQKHGAGDGRIIPEEDDDQKIAKQNWSEKDEHELQEELAEG